MKTTGVSCETKFGLLVFLGHPSEEPEPDCMKTSAQPRQAATNSKHSGGRLKALVRAQVRNKQASSHVKTLKYQI